MKGCWECCYLVSTSPLSRPAFPVSLEHIYSAIDTPWNLSCILVIHWHQSLSTLNNIYKYTGDLLCAGWPVPGPLRPWSEPEIPRARTKFVTDSIWRNVNKQLEAAREMEPRREDQAPLPHCGHNTCRWVFCDISLSHWHLISTHQGLIPI